MSSSGPQGDATASAAPVWQRVAAGRPHQLIIAGLLLVGALLAFSSLLGDSVTFDETFHLASGYAPLVTGDYRLTPDHPPLGRIWCAWPLLLLGDVRWLPPDDPDWVNVEQPRVCQRFLFELNDGQRLVVIGRAMMVLLLLGTCLATYALARTLFGPLAGLLALLLAAFSPTLLAHGRLVTTDMPVTLLNTLTLLTFARLMQRISWGRLLLAAATFAALTISKMSWPLVLPALAVMLLVAVLRKQPLEVAPSAKPTTEEPHGGVRPIARRGERAGLLVGVAAFCGLVAWAAIWAAYQGQYSMLAPAPPEQSTPEAEARLDRAAEQLALNWQIALLNPDGTPRRGLLPALLQLVADLHLLPEGYVYGLSQTMRFTSARNAYLMGAYSDTGWRSYFPIAFAIKTPVATLLLVAAGAVVLVRARLRSQNALLLTGVLTYLVVYAAVVISSRTNLGQRHLLPLYPLLFALAGAAVAWLGTRTGRVALGAAVVWLVGANLWIHPHYLAYFNELIGGPAQGQRWLADSNIDWGQDLLRLARYAHAHPLDEIKLAYFGSADPNRYLDCTALPSYFSFEPRAELTPGTYVVAVTQLLGVYDPEIRDTFWTAQNREAYGALGQIAASIPQPDEPAELAEQRDQARREFVELRQKRLLNRLQQRPPDDRVGYSLFVYRLKAEDLAELTRP